MPGASPWGRCASRPGASLPPPLDPAPEAAAQRAAGVSEARVEVEEGRACDQGGPVSTPWRWPRWRGRLSRPRSGSAALLGVPQTPRIGIRPEVLGSGRRSRGVEGAGGPLLWKKGRGPHARFRVWRLRRETPAHPRPRPPESPPGPGGCLRHRAAE